MCRPVSVTDLVNHDGRSIVPELVRWRERWWRQKRGEGWREILAHRLGGSWLNVAEAISPGEVDGGIRWDGSPFDPSADPTSSLVRLIQDYRVEEFPEQDPDRATAGELVFSLWVRRRDAHAWNRAYVDGVPGFFDHHIAFGAEDANRSLDGFFREGGDAGYVSRWRVQVLPEGERLTTAGERHLGSGELAIHRVHDLKAFDGDLDDAVKRIACFDDVELRSHAVSARARAGEPFPPPLAGRVTGSAPATPELPLPRLNPAFVATRPTLAPAPSVALPLGPFTDLTGSGRPRSRDLAGTGDATSGGSVPASRRATRRTVIRLRRRSTSRITRHQVPSTWRRYRLGLLSRRRTFPSGSARIARRRSSCSSAGISSSTRLASGARSFR